MGKQTAAACKGVCDAAACRVYRVELLEGDVQSTADCSVVQSTAA